MGNYSSDKITSRFVGLKFNRTTDADILDYLANLDNIQGYIKRLIREDIARSAAQDAPDAETIKIQFEAGTSRYSDRGVNFLTSADGALYAEVEVPETGEFSEDYGYLPLKAEILRQAAEQNIDASRLEFWYDGQEQHLASDASDGSARS